ncbi:MAG: single-stranded-DNA-specific exonuclease RecJ [Chlorobiaceae bacterium]|nr:single-stranded-DNA-specific exonuclease RecJ [Chlorobiaceae bacterium]
MKKQYRWRVAEQPNELQVMQLAKEINVPETIARILFHRGITTYQLAKEFFRPQLSDLHDPFLMQGMEQAVVRILRAIENQERLLIFGDYDVDGTASAAMLHLYFKKLGLESIIHIPDRVKEGYGISTLGIDEGKQFGATLLISIDCGITAIDQVEYARSLGIDVIICDHHEPGESLPNALAVLDPLISTNKYPFKNLCGCGVGFKLIQAIERRRDGENMAEKFIDFVTLATTADIVPLIGENRILTKIGLQQINTNPRPGIRALIETSGSQLGKISTGQIVFVLAPRINAVGRMGDATRAVTLLTNENISEAIELAQVLETENRNRRKIDEDTFLKAQELVERYLEVEPDPAIVLHNEEWHPGVIGIVASRLVEKYYRPTVMMTTVDGVAKGSARSIVGFDIHQALKRVEDKLLQFGGHKYAAGLSVALDRVDEFREAFNLVVNELLTDNIRTPEIKIDTEITLGDLNPRFLKILKEFAPYGPSNMRPIFLARNVETIGVPKIVGKDHLRFRVKQNQYTLDAIGFGLGALLEDVRDGGKALDLVFSVDEHEIPISSAGTTESFPQLKIKDIRKHIPDSPIEPVNAIE